MSVLLHLGYGFLRASATLPFRVGRGRDRVLRGFAPEGLIPATEEQRALSAAFERCIGCGFCDLELEEELPLSELATSLWRSPETLPALAEVLDRLSEADLERAEAICPTGVPLSRLVAGLRSSLKTWAEWGEVV